MYAGTVEFLLILGGNPVYTAPADLNFAAAMERVPTRAHLSLYEDETSALCQWHIPEAHFLEAWSDVRADDGTATIIQPLIAPLYGGKSAHEVVSAIDGRERSGYDLVREYWSRETGLSTQAPARTAAVGRPAAGAGALRRRNAAGVAAAGDAGVAAGCGAAPSPIAAAPVPQLSPFDREWRDGCTTASFRTRHLRRRTVTLGGGFAQSGAGRGRRGIGLGDRLPPGSERVRRPLRQQRVAAGAPEIAHETDLGQRRADVSGHRRAAVAHQRRRRRSQAGRPHDSDAGLARARTGARTR